MLPKMDTIGMTPLTPVKGTRAADAVADPRQAEFQRSLQGLIGKSMQGQVLARMGDGSYLVRVAGTPARMQLPAGAQLGTEIPLTLIGINPRPSFQIGTNRDQPASPLTVRLSLRSVWPFSAACQKVVSSCVSLDSVRRST